MLLAIGLPVNSIRHGRLIRGENMSLMALHYASPPFSRVADSSKISMGHVLHSIETSLIIGSTWSLKHSLFLSIVWTPTYWPKTFFEVLSFGASFSFFVLWSIFIWSLGSSSRPFSHRWNLSHRSCYAGTTLSWRSLSLTMLVPVLTNISGRSLCPLSLSFLVLISM